MIKALLRDDIKEAAPYMDADVLDYISQGRTETFEGFEGYYLFAVAWSEVERDSDARSKVEKIILFRKELIRRKRYYEQLTDIFENLKIDDEKLLSHDAKRHFAILQSRAEKLCSTVMNLRDYVTQMREAYQSQVDIEQNQLMKYFTVITALFLPLTLLVGWYGMNFTNMPELTWKYGYASIIGLSILICTGMILWFKKKKWF